MIKFYKNLDCIKTYFINKSFIKNVKISFQFYGFNAQQRSNLARKFLQKETICKQNFEVPLKKKIPSSSIPSRNKKVPLVVTRKLNKLDKIFLEKITDLLSTSEYGAEILENRIEIKKAQVQIGFSAIHVFWTSPDARLDIKINCHFIKIAPLIRHELKQLNVFGRVPPLIFIKDITHDLMADIDKRLALADFGEDYEPTNSAYNIITGNILHKQLKEEVWNSLNQKSKEVTDMESVWLHDSESIPKLKQNVYGLDRNRIMNDILKGMRSSKGDHRKSKEELDIEHQRSFISPIIAKNNSFMQIDGTRTSNIRLWAKEFRRKKMKIMKQFISENEQYLSIDENYEKTNFYSKDMIDDNDFIEPFDDDHEIPFK